MKLSVLWYLLGSSSCFLEIVLCVDIITSCDGLHLFPVLCQTLGFIGRHSETDRAASGVERASYASLKGDGYS